MSSAINKSRLLTFSPAFVRHPFAAAAVAEIGLAQVDLFGFSVGGAVALRLAIEHPERVRRLVASSITFDDKGSRPE